MKIITLFEPFATLMVIGAKQIETRSWKTNHRGKLGIHASKQMPKWCRELLHKPEFKKALGEREFNLGHLIGDVEVVDMVPTKIQVTKWRQLNPIRFPDEHHFGDYSDGRWGWITRNPAQYPYPIPLKGSMGIWNGPDIELISPDSLTTAK